MARKIPRWIRAVVDELQTTLEPEDYLAPLGFSFKRDKEGWLISAFPRRNELIGGMHDGTQQVPGFRLCLTGAMTIFDAPPHVQWDSPSVYDGNYDGPCVIFHGLYRGRDLELVLYDQPPAAAKLGLLIDWQRGEVKPCKRSG